MRKKILWAMLLMAVIAVSGALFFFTRPSVCLLVSSLLPEDYVNALSRPSSVSFRYRSRVVSDSSYNGKADLVIAMPPAETDDADAVYIGRGQGRILSVDEVSLFSYPLSLGSKDVFAFIFDSSDEAAVSLSAALKEIRPDLVLVPYERRISSANIDEVLDMISSSGASRVIIHSPLSALRFIQEADPSLRLYADWRDAAALKDLRKVIAIVPDWDMAIAAALDGSSDIPLHFALSVT